ncbi:MAG TPA: cupin-like domain-containing protein [Rhodanobacter sp.]
MNQRAACIDVDWDAFDPWRVQAVRHRLTEHPLLQPDRLVEFGLRLERAAQLYSFSNDVTAGANFSKAGSTNPNRKSAQETLQDIGHAKAWMLLRHVQGDPVYRGLVDSVLDEVKPRIERKDPGMCYRAGWIFVSSPHTVTPFHIDRNHGILLQLRGSKTVYVWDPDDTTVVSDRAREWFHGHRELTLVEWREEFRDRAHVFHLQPGMGVYMPLTSPHMVETSDEPSTTLSLSYNTDASRRNVLLHVVRDRMRGLGIGLPPVGRHPRFDACLHAAAHATEGMRRYAHRWLGRPVHFDGAPYASDD